jgi:DNA-binding response OmpR family regulator
MRFLPAARIVVLDADRDHRAFICASLGELGLLQVLPAATLPEAREIAEKQPIDLCVVDPRGFEALARAEGKKVIANPFRQDAIPAVLLSADTSRAMVAAATEAGYRAIVGLPVVPRFLYRRIGSILQKTRRAGRSAVEEAQAGSNAPGFSESRRQRN